MSIEQHDDQTSHEQTFRTMSEELPRVVQQLEDMGTNPGKITGVPTGFDRIDMFTGGLGDGELILLAARPSVGKTTLALNIAVESAKLGTSVCYFSLELGIDSICTRMLTAEALVNSWNVRSGKMNDGDWAAINQAALRLNTLDIAIDDTPSSSIQELRSRAMQRLRNTEGNRLIIVDDLQQIQPVRYFAGNRLGGASEISYELKMLAKDLNVPILALSQLSRRIEWRDDKRPLLSDLRGPDSLEQDADIVLFLDRNTRPPCDGEELSENQEARLYIAKHRNGPIGAIALAYIRRYVKFVSLAPWSANDDDHE
ncbi:MAG: AAA family ATPase [Actinomycetia bacterium]|nr:AAA family ATPase [Actinomycetes bacterium]